MWWKKAALVLIVAAAILTALPLVLGALWPLLPLPQARADTIR